MWTAGLTLTGPPVMELDTELVVTELIFLGFLKNSEILFCDMLKFTLRFVCLTEITSLKVTLKLCVVIGNNKSS